MKKEVVIAIILFVVLFIIMFLINLFNGYKILTKKRKSKKDKSIISIKYLKLKFNLNEKRMLTLGFISFVTFIDALIITTVFLVVSLIHTKVVLQLLIGFVLLFGLIYAIYEIIGRILVRSGYQDEL